MGGNNEETSATRGRHVPCLATSLKNSLKRKILTKREETGLGPITLENEREPETHQMTEEEMEKDKKRRISNRQSAHRSREKQKSEFTCNLKLKDDLEEEGFELLRKKRRLEDEKRTVLQKLQECGVTKKQIETALQRVVIRKVSNENSSASDDSISQQKEDMIQRIDSENETDSVRDATDEGSTDSSTSSLTQQTPPAVPEAEYTITIVTSPVDTLDITRKERNNVPVVNLSAIKQFLKQHKGYVRDRNILNAISN